MIKNIKMLAPSNPYDPKWVEFNTMYPRMPKAVGADVVDGDTAAAEAAKAAAEAAAAEAAKVKNKGSNVTADEIAAAKAAAEAAQKAAAETVAAKEAEVKNLADKVKQANEKLRQFEGLEAEEIRKLLADKKAAEEKELAARGEWERLKERMANEHKAEVDRLAAMLESIKSELGQKDSLINKLTIGHSFDGSKFIRDEMVLTPAKARALYSEYFEVNDGVVVGYDRPRGDSKRTPLVDSLGRPVAFDDAIRKIVEADTDRDTLLKSKLKPGAASNTDPHAKPTAPKTELRGMDKILAAMNAKKAGINK